MESQESDSSENKIQSQSKEAARRYIRAYHLYIQGEDDLVGRIAYGLYTAQISKWIEWFRSTNGGKLPTSKQVSDYVDALCGEDTVCSYRKRAGLIYQNVLRKEIAKEVEERANALYEQMIIKKIDVIEKKLDRRNKFGGWEGFAAETGKTIFAVLAAGVIAGVLSLGFGMAEKLGHEAKEAIEAYMPNHKSSTSPDTH